MSVPVKLARPKLGPAVREVGPTIVSPPRSRDDLVPFARLATPRLGALDERRDRSCHREPHALAGIPAPGADESRTPPRR